VNGVSGWGSDGQGIKGGERATYRLSNGAVDLSERSAAASNDS
jgi:hypothetical protein